MRAQSNGKISWVLGSQGLRNPPPPTIKEQASPATTTTHPLFMTPFTPEELKHEIKKLHPDKSPGPSGITNRMLQAGDTDFNGLILIFFNGLWEFHTQSSDWQLSLLQPIYKGHNKDKTDPASYRGIYLNDTIAKLLEGLLISRLTTHTELLNAYTQPTRDKTRHTNTRCYIFSVRPYSAQQIYPRQTHLRSFHRLLHPGRLPLRSS